MTAALLETEGPYARQTPGAPWLPPTTFASLLRDAGTDLREAARAGGSGGWTRPAAFGAIVACSEALDGLGALWSRLWRQLEPVPAPMASLGALLTHRPADPIGAPSVVATRCRSAAVTVRAAADLLATHLDAGGAPRSAEAVMLQDPQQVLRAAGLVADVVLEAARCAEVLAAQAGRTGIGAAQLARMVGDPARLAGTAQRCRQTAPRRPCVLAGLGPARSRPRSAPAAAELADRLAQLRQYAWRLAHTPRVSTTTLADLAAVATDLNGFAAAAGWPTSAPGAWRTLRTTLSELRTTTPPSAAVRGEAALVRRLLTGALSRDAARPTVQVAVDRLPEVAEWGLAAFRTATHDGVFVPGSALRGVEVSDQPELAVAKLRGRTVPAPSARLDAVVAAYGRARQAAGGGGRRGELSSPSAAPC